MELTSRQNQFIAFLKGKWLPENQTLGSFREFPEISSFIDTYIFSGNEKEISIRPHKAFEKHFPPIEPIKIKGFLRIVKREHYGLFVGQDLEPRKASYQPSPDNDLSIPERKALMLPEEGYDFCVPLHFYHANSFTRWEFSKRNFDTYVKADELYYFAVKNRIQNIEKRIIDILKDIYGTQEDHNSEWQNAYKHFDKYDCFDKRFYTIPEAAIELGLSEEQIVHLISTQQINVDIECCQIPSDETKNKTAMWMGIKTETARSILNGALKGVVQEEFYEFDYSPEKIVIPPESLIQPRYFKYLDSILEGVPTKNPLALSSDSVEIPDMEAIRNQQYQTRAIDSEEQSKQAINLQKIQKLLDGECGTYQAPELAICLRAWLELTELGEQQLLKHKAGTEISRWLDKHHPTIKLESNKKFERLIVVTNWNKKEK